MTYILKKDEYRRARGGKAFLISLLCAKCGIEILIYQKDGDGPLKRCYLNRIHAPAGLEGLQRDSRMRSPEDVPHLKCPGCGIVIGAAIRHHDGRLAFRLRPGFFRKRRIIQ